MKDVADRTRFDGEDDVRWLMFALRGLVTVLFGLVSSSGRA